MTNPELLVNSAFSFHIVTFPNSEYSFRSMLMYIGVPNLTWLNTVS